MNKFPPQANLLSTIIKFFVNNKFLLASVMKLAGMLSSEIRMRWTNKLYCLCKPLLITIMEWHGKFGGVLNVKNKINLIREREVADKKGYKYLMMIHDIHI